jgi:peptidoglycan hydrolase-like protein with peptidoglycan-binding domain/3D (Asp-Asp-Asp) domain-containing protein
MKKLIALAVVIWSVLGTVPMVNAYSYNGKLRTFTITGYYSPLLNQNLYLTGSYKSEIRLNGSGIAGADGTLVYPGMIAAPKSFAFGTKIKIPGLGVGMVNDRGGAIVEKGERDLAKHDRLDIWMGYGDEGLRRALSFGVQHIDCEIFSNDAPIQVGMNFSVPPMLKEIVDFPDRKNFSQNFAIGSRSRGVKDLQRALRDVGFYERAIHGTFDEHVEDAVYAFQKKNFIVRDKEEAGAGVFGPRTRAELSTQLFDAEIQKRVQEAWEKFKFEDDLERGRKNASVLKLQQMLVQQEFMTVTPTGYFGPKTEEALIKFQLAYSIVARKTSTGAGKMGPSTREVFNEILSEQKEALTKERAEMLSFRKTQQKFAVLSGNVQLMNGSSIVVGDKLLFTQR